MLGSLGFPKMNQTFRADLFLREITDRENRKYRDGSVKHVNPRETYVENPREALGRQQFLQGTDLGGKKGEGA